MQSRIWGGGGGKSDECDAKDGTGKGDWYKWMGKGLEMLDYASNLLESVDRQAKVKLVDDENGKSALERRRLKLQEGLKPTQTVGPSIGQAHRSNMVQLGSHNPLDNENSSSTVPAFPSSIPTSNQSLPVDSNRIHYEAAQLSLELENADEKLSAQESELRLAAARLDCQLEKVESLEMALQKALKAVEENESRRVEAERRADELSENVRNLDEEFNTQHMMELSSVNELQRSLERVKDARAEDGKHLREVQARQAELESSNASLNEQLASKSQEFDLANMEIKRLADACSSLEALSSDTLPRNHLGLTGHHSDVVALEEVKENLELLKAEEMEEVLKVKRAEEEINCLKHDLTVVRLSCDNESKALRAAEMRAEQAEEALREKSMAAAVTTVPPTQPPPSQGIQDRLIQELREQLMEKQRLLDDVLTDKSALQARLHSATTRICKMEARLFEMGDGFDITDIENCGGGGNDIISENINSIGGESQRLLHYRGGMRQPIGVNGRKQIVHRSILGRNQRVRRVVNALDRASLTAGRFLNSVPLARLGFILYLLLLHVW